MASTTAHYMPKECHDSDKLNTHRSVLYNLPIPSNGRDGTTTHYTPKEYTVTATN